MKRKKSMCTKRKTKSRMKKGFHVVKKGSKYQVVHQPTAGRPTVERTFTSKKAAQNHVRLVKSISKQYKSLLFR